jgi:hypothetical protein
MLPAEKSVVGKTDYDPIIPMLAVWYGDNKKISFHFTVENISIIIILLKTPGHFSSLCLKPEFLYFRPQTNRADFRTLSRISSLSPAPSAGVYLNVMLLTDKRKS